MNMNASTPSKLDVVVVRTQAKEALVGFGWKSAMLVLRLPRPRRSTRPPATTRHERERLDEPIR
jgi:hypothetical protein